MADSIAIPARDARSHPTPPVANSRNSDCYYCHRYPQNYSDRDSVAGNVSWDWAPSKKAAGHLVQALYLELHPELAIGHQTTRPLLLAVVTTAHRSFDCRRTIALALPDFQIRKPRTERSPFQSIAAFLCPSSEKLAIAYDNHILFLASIYRFGPRQTEPSPYSPTEKPESRFVRFPRGRLYPISFPSTDYGFCLT